MLKVVTPAFFLALLAGAVCAGPAGPEVRMGTPETVASACKLAPGFGSIWQASQDDDVYVRDVFADVRSNSDVRSAVARFKAELRDRAMVEMAARQRFLPGRMTLTGCANLAANAGTDATVEDPLPPLRWQ